MTPAGSVQTVLGSTELSKLGRTLTHEHLALDFDKFYVPPPRELSKHFRANFDIGNLGFVRQYPYSSRYNVTFNDVDTRKAIFEEIKLFKLHGGGTIVENTSHGIKRDIPLMVQVSQQIGVNIIVGTGHYVEACQKDLINEEQMYNLILKELTEGCEEYPSIKAGFIGEVGSSWPITEFEKKAIRATAKVQKQLNCPVSFHPGRNSQAPFEIMRIYLEAGGDSKKAVMSHLDRTLMKKDELLEFAKLGCYTQFDLFGTECSYYQLDEKTDMPSDAQRLDRIGWIKQDRGVEQVLMSHDIHTKHRLVQFGGHGYSHIYTNILPRMPARGFTAQEIDTITIDNPRRWLAY
ncbi:GSCOCG00009422001-RA-CDS [Cotesia congregata]|uniref:Phosphotriesterase-related protein n=1 Tax=Cotesia congregata TaxID=51543 RepID=A0A8J2HNF6_COTCN|nr:GSCOCG00009422001-RA-CDS [Cotesia congregata]CAG5102420.1 Similar to GF17207: Phosphotriesterase-related protein (Drosophila ananassae) [Cotesia congregata]